MLPPYANKATKETLLCLSGSKGFCQTLLEEGAYFRNRKGAEKYIKAASENLQLAINEMCVGLDESQYRGIIRYGNGLTLAVVPKSSSCSYTEAQNDYIVSKDAMRVFLQSPTSECAFCELTGKEARECQIRKALLESLVISESEEGDCPYKL